MVGTTKSATCSSICSHRLQLLANLLVNLEELEDASIDADGLALVKVAFCVSCADALCMTCPGCGIGDIATCSKTARQKEI